MMNPIVWGGVVVLVALMLAAVVTTADDPLSYVIIVAVATLGCVLIYSGGTGHASQYELEAGHIHRTVTCEQEEDTAHLLAEKDGDIRYYTYRGQCPTSTIFRVTGANEVAPVE